VNKKRKHILHNRTSPGDTAWIVEQDFSSPADEAIFGLGQYQFDVIELEKTAT